MRRKGGEATCVALAPHSSGLKVPPATGGGDGLGVDPSPESESRAVLILGLLFHGSESVALGIVTRKGEDVRLRERSE